MHQFKPREHCRVYPNVCKLKKKSFRGQRPQDGIQNVTKQSKSFTNEWNNLTKVNGKKDAALEKVWKLVAPIRLKISIVQWLKRLFPGVPTLTVLSLLYMYTGNKQLSKWMADCGSQVSHSLIASLQKARGRD